MRTMLAMVFLGAITIGHALIGCTSRLGPVRVSQTEGGIDRANLPSIAIEQSVECMVEYGRQLEPGRHQFEAIVEVNEDRHRNVGIDGLPNTAPDFGACMRNILRNMPIAESPFREGVVTLKYLREHANDGQDALIRFIEVIHGVPIVVSKVVLEAEGYTVVIPVAVRVVDKPRFIDDERIMAKLGQMAIDTLGYEKIMTRAEDMGWVETVAVEQALSIADKRFIADGPPPSSAVVEAAFKRVMTRAAPTALLASQADSPAPGPGDLVALGILAAGLVAVGGITVYELVTAPPAAATTAAPAPAPAAQPNATPPPPPPPQKQPACPQNERFIPEHTDDARGCYTKKGNLQCYARRHYPCAGVHTHGRRIYQERRGNRCVEVDERKVRCEGSFQTTGSCGSVSTVLCGTEGWATSGFFDE